MTWMAGVRRELAGTPTPKAKSAVWGAPGLSTRTMRRVGGCGGGRLGDGQRRCRSSCRSTSRRVRGLRLSSGRRPGRARSRRGRSGTCRRLESSRGEALLERLVAEGDMAVGLGAVESLASDLDGDLRWVILHLEERGEALPAEALEVLRHRRRGAGRRRRGDLQAGVGVVGERR